MERREAFAVATRKKAFQRERERERDLLSSCAAHFSIEGGKKKD